MMERSLLLTTVEATKGPRLLRFSVATWKQRRQPHLTHCCSPETVLAEHTSGSSHTRVSVAVLSILCHEGQVSWWPRLSQQCVQCEETSQEKGSDPVVLSFVASSFGHRGSSLGLHLSLFRGQGSVGQLYLWVISGPGPIFIRPRSEWFLNLKGFCKTKKPRMKMPHRPYGICPAQPDTSAPV